jgi:hypothetical protein
MMSTDIPSIAEGRGQILQQHTRGAMQQLLHDRQVDLESLEEWTKVNYFIKYDCVRFLTFHLGH